MFRKPIVILLFFLAACTNLPGQIEVGVESPFESATNTPEIIVTEEPTPELTATNVPTLEALTGFASGRVCYPSEFIPAMTAYFVEIGTGDLTEIGIAENQSTYRVELPVGAYHAFAWVEDFQIGGGYTAYVSCGYTENCTDHSLQAFEITGGQERTGIDLCDWPLQTDQLPLPPNTSQRPTPEDAILILEPGPGSQLTSPLRVAGMADSTFEQHLVVRIILDDGAELALAPTIIQTELGQRGPFSIEIPFTITGERQAFIQVYATSARDGGTTHLSSVGVTLTDTGPVDIRPVTDYAERINIYTPGLGSTVSGGSALVSGFALASFEQHLLVEVLDVDGNVIGFSPVIVTAPDWGIPGPFVVDIPYTLEEAGPGRVVVRDPSPAFDGDVHLASVEIMLEP